MMGKIFRARHAMGQTVRGVALVANDGFSARYDLDRNAGLLRRFEDAIPVGRHARS